MDDENNLPEDMDASFMKSFMFKAGKWIAIVGGTVIAEESLYGLIQKALVILGWIK